jgi:hypothetical protein
MDDKIRPIDYLYGLAVVAIVILTAMLEGGMC